MVPLAIYSDSPPLVEGGACCISLVVFYGPFSHLLGFSTISEGGACCISLVVFYGPFSHLLGFSTISEGGGHVV